MKKAALLAATLFVLTSLTALAQTSVPPLVNYQGMLTDKDGKGLEGTKKLEFNLYDDAGTKVWGPQIFDPVYLAGGRFNVILGTTDTSGRSVADAFTTGYRYLSITVDGMEISPRQQILSAPYAIVANTVQGPNLHVNPTNGRVGIGTTNPTVKLDVAGNIVAYGKLNIFKPIVNNSPFG